MKIRTRICLTASLTALAIIILLYCAYSYVNLEPNPLKFDSEIRLSFAILSALTVILSLFVAFIIELPNSKK